MRKPYSPPAVIEEYTGVSRENPFGLRWFSGHLSAFCTNCLEVVATDIDGHRLHVHQHFECRESDHVKNRR